MTNQEYKDLTEFKLELFIGDFLPNSVFPNKFNIPIFRKLDGSDVAEWLESIGEKVVRHYDAGRNGVAITESGIRVSSNGHVSKPKFNLVENKKGNKGFIVGQWNFVGWLKNEPQSGYVGTYIKSVEVKSCGKKQMTLMVRETGYMSHEFFSPNKHVHATIESAKAECEEIFNVAIHKSLELAPAALERDRASYSQYSWFEKSEREQLAWIEKMKTGRVVHEIKIL